MKTKAFIGTLVISVVIGCAALVAHPFVSGDNKTESPGYYYNKSWVSYGDSLTAGGQWQKLVLKELDFAKGHTNLGLTGSTITMLRTDPKPLVHADRIEQIKKAKPDVITIFGGANDIHNLRVDGNIGTNAEFEKPLAEKNLQTYYGAYSYLIETLRDWKPSLQIVIIVQCDYVWDNQWPALAKQVRQATIDIAMNYKLQFVDCNDIGINENTVQELTSDGTHFANTPTVQKLADLVTATFKHMIPQI